MNKSCRKWHTNEVLVMKGIVLFFLTLCLTACATNIDNEYTKQENNRLPLTKLNGTFNNKSLYQTNSLADEKISSAFKEYDIESDQVRMKFNEAIGLEVQFLKNNKIIKEKTFTIDKDITIDENKSILFTKKHDVPFCDCPAIYYENKQYSLYINNDNNLVFVNKETSAGLFIVMPMAGTSKVISEFERVKE